MDFNFTFYFFTSVAENSDCSILFCDQQAELCSTDFDEESDDEDEDDWLMESLR